MSENALADARATLASQLSSAGIPIAPYVPGRITPPIIVVEAGDPWITGGTAYGDLRVHFTLSLITAAGSNDTVTDAIEDMAAAVLAARGDWGLDHVSGPYIATVNGSQFVSIQVDLSDDITL